jgi:hypothetical protein
VRVQANSVEDLYGVAFDLLFPVTLLEYQGTAEGTFLSAGGAGTTMQVFQGAGGRLVAGATRLGAVGGVGGTGTILELEFTLLAAGTGELRFESQQGFDAAGTAISGLSWSGGTLRVVR